MINFLMGAIVGTLAKQAGYSFWVGTLWVVVIVALSTAYGAVEVARSQHRCERLHG